MTQAPPPPSLVKTVGFTYFPIAFIARLPFAMTVVGVLTLVATVRESYADAGITSAFVGIGSALFGPFLGALADRLGQCPVLLVAAILNAAALVLITVLVYSPVALPFVLIAAVLVGATSPQLSPMSRSRLVAILVRTLPLERHPKAISGTMSYESMADELVFVFGPVLVGVLAFLIGPWSPIVLAAVLTLVFVGSFALHPSALIVGRSTTAGADDAPQRSRASELFTPPILVLVAGMFAIGLFFGAALTALTAFMGVYAEESQAGIVYGAMGLGSAIFALGVVLLPARFTLRARWLVFTLLALAGASVLSFVASVPAMVVVLMIIGFGIGPSLVTLYSLASERAPVGRATTVMTMLGGGIILGQATASALTGVVAQSSGHTAAFHLVTAATGVMVALGIANWVIEVRGRA